MSTTQDNITKKKIARSKKNTVIIKKIRKMSSDPNDHNWLCEVQTKKAGFVTQVDLATSHQHLI